jgi:hypothetical protein
LKEEKKKKTRVCSDENHQRCVASVIIDVEEGGLGARPISREESLSGPVVLPDR